MGGSIPVLSLCVFKAQTMTCIFISLSAGMQFEQLCSLQFVSCAEDGVFC